MNVANIKECEKMCYSEDKFKCSVFSFRYSDPTSNNCLLCDRSFSLLDSYADIVPDKDFDIYAMSDDISVCKKEQQAPSRESPTYGHPNDRKNQFHLQLKRWVRLICISLYRVLPPFGRPATTLRLNRTRLVDSPLDR